MHPSGADPAAALGAHEELRQAFASYLAADCRRRAILLPGVRDRAFLYDPGANAAVVSAGFEIALEVDLESRHWTGRRRCCVEPGWQFDERNAFEDPADPRDTPLGHHAVAEILPALESSATPWLEGIDRLEDPSGLPRFVASRITYRRVVRWLWWLLVPIAVALFGRLPDYWVFGMPKKLEPFSSRLLGLGLTLVAEVIVAGVVLAVVNHRIWHSAGRSLAGAARPPGERHRPRGHPSHPGRGGVGLVTGHTLQPELARVGSGFYANAGACGEVVEERASRLGLAPGVRPHPPGLLGRDRGGVQVHARLLLARRYLRPVTVLERFAAARLPRDEGEPEVVASYPGGARLARPSSTRRARCARMRRLAAAGIAVLGLADLVSAVVPPQLRGQLHPLFGYIPLGVSEAAGALVALAGVGLLALARGVRRGQRLAWLVSMMLLGGTVALHVIRHGEVIQSVAALALMAFLWWTRRSFHTGFDLPSLRAGLVTLFGGVLAVTCIGATVLWSVIPTHRGGRPITWATAWWATAGRLVGVRTVALNQRVDAFLYPALLAIGLGLAAVALVLFFRPVVDRRRTGGHSEIADRAADIVRRRGMGTLDYFALRATNSSSWSATASSPTPSTAGSAWSRPTRSALRPSATSSGRRSVATPTSTAGRSPCSGQGRTGSASTGVRACTSATSATRASSTCGASPSRAAPARACARRSTASPSTATRSRSTTRPGSTPSSRTPCGRSWSKNRRGEVERGFSMTLGRIFDSRDSGLLLAIAHGPGGEPVAFCQFVPAPGINGYSLDLMRRDDGEHPNGLLDFILVRTIERLRAGGDGHLGLNFAAMRAVLAGEDGGGLQRWLLRRMSDSMQIESLWRFNAKFGPEWLPRYVVWDAAENTLPTALAIARAESFWELPLIGRFFQPADSEDGVDHTGAADRRKTSPPQPAGHPSA